MSTIRTQVVSRAGLRGLDDGELPDNRHLHASPPEIQKTATRSAWSTPTAFTPKSTFGTENTQDTIAATNTPTLASRYHLRRLL